MMPLISSTTTPLLAPSSMAFVSPTTWKGLIRTHRSERQTRMIFEPLKLLADDNSEEETGLNDDPTKFYESNATTDNSTAKRSYSMGTTIGAQNVGEMLFNKELLKSGRGDVRVGNMKRWKDFRGNEIVPDNNTTEDTPNGFN